MWYPFTHRERFGSSLCPEGFPKSDPVASANVWLCLYHVTNYTVSTATHVAATICQHFDVTYFHLGSVAQWIGRGTFNPKIQVQVPKFSFSKLFYLVVDSHDIARMHSPVGEYASKVKKLASFPWFLIWAVYLKLPRAIPLKRVGKVVSTISK